MITVVHSPKNSLRRIDTIWAAISTDEGGEGLCAVFHEGVWTPLIAADEARLQWIVDQARALAQLSGKHIEVVKFTSRIGTMQISAFGGDCKPEAGHG
jgi:hypothetical protein